MPLFDGAARYYKILHFRKAVAMSVWHLGARSRPPGLLLHLAHDFRKDYGGDESGGQH